MTDNLSIELIDPATVVIDENVRTDAELSTEFVASIKARGVLQPITCHRDGDRLVLRTGQRRVLAAQQLELPAIPALIVPATERTDLILDQLVENDARASMSQRDRVAAVEQLMLEGLTVAQIARRSGTKKAEVTHAATVAASQVAVAAADMLTLEQAAALAEFEDDPECAEELIAAAHEGQFDHALSRARQDRQLRAAEAHALAEALTEGRATAEQVTERPAYDSDTRRLERLVDAEGNDLDEEAHRSCPGHVIWASASQFQRPVDANGTILANMWDDARVGYVQVVETEVSVGCCDPSTHGHRDRWSRSDTGRPRAADMSEEEREKARAERQQVIARNKEWPACTVVRREWLREFATRKTPAQGAEAWVAGELSRQYGDRDGHTGTVAGLLGMTSDELHEQAKTAAPRRAVHLSACWLLAAYEARNGTSKDQWRYLDESRLNALRQMVAWGYTPSELEQELIAAAEKE